MKLSRRLIRGLQRYGLASLVHQLNLSASADWNYHRAMYDALLTVELWKRIGCIISERTDGKTPDHEIYHTLMKKSKAKTQEYLEKVKESIK